MSLTAAISNISRCSLHDGPGIRTVVYLKGCALRCRWCHNPEALRPEPQVLYAPVKCIHCGRCVSVCPEHHVIRGNDMVYLREGCAGCGKCAEACPSGALSLCGENMTVDQVFAEVAKDAAYYESTGGGVTLSGGECLLQPEFSAALLKRCREAGIHTVIETALFVAPDALDAVLPWVDSVFADLKIADPEKHRIYAGQDNRLILKNLRELTAVHRRITVRIPVIPGVNDGPEDMEGFAGIIDSLGPGASEVELLKYNHLAGSKYSQAGMKYQAFSDTPQDDTQMESLRQILSARLKTKRKVFFR